MTLCSARLPADTLMAFLHARLVHRHGPKLRARAAPDAATQAVADHCGIGSNLGKTRVMAAKRRPTAARHR